MKLSKFSVREIISFIIITLLMTVSVIPGYQLIGSLSLQIIVTMGISLLIVLLADIFRIKPKSVSYSLCVMIAFWVILALVLQVKTHIQLNDYSLKWYYLFYYDKIGMLYVVWAVATIYYIIKLMIKRNDCEFYSQYKEYSKIANRVLFVFYLLTFFYGFVLCRVPSPERDPGNFIPFRVMKDTFFSGYFDYERLTLFFGNIGIFLPLGIILSALFSKKNKWLAFVIPVALSMSIEATQYFFNFGNCDIDDVILNVLGAYLGICIKRLLDLLVYKTSKGKIESVFFI